MWLILVLVLILVLNPFTLLLLLAVLGPVIVLVIKWVVPIIVAITGIGQLFGEGENSKKGFGALLILVSGFWLYWSVTSTDQWSRNTSAQIAQMTDIEILNITLGSNPSIMTRVTNNDQREHKICIGGTIHAVVEENDSSTTYNTWWNGDLECNVYPPNSSANIEINPFENIMALEPHPYQVRSNYSPHQICVKIIYVDNDEWINVMKWRQDESLSCDWGDLD